MAVYPAPNNPLVARVAINFARDTRVLVNVFHVAKASPWSESQLRDLASVIQTWLNPSYAACLPNTISAKLIQLRRLDPSNPIGVDWSLGVGIPGSLATGAEGGNVTNTLSFRTGLAGRPYRGRIYIPGLTIADVSPDDRVSSAQVTREGSAAQNLINALVAASWQLVVFHRPGLLPKPLDNLFTPVTSYVIENLVDSQRRRLPGRGR